MGSLFLSIRPVIFFSRNEHLIKNSNANYMLLRKNVGKVVTNIKSLIEAVKSLDGDIKKYEKGILKLREENLYNIGESDEFLKKSIENILEKKNLKNSIEFFK